MSRKKLKKNIRIFLDRPSNGLWLVSGTWRQFPAWFWGGMFIWAWRLPRARSTNSKRGLDKASVWLHTTGGGKAAFLRKAGRRWVQRSFVPARSYSFCSNHPHFTSCKLCSNAKIWSGAATTTFSPMSPGRKLRGTQRLPPFLKNAAFPPPVVF